MEWITLPPVTRWLLFAGALWSIFLAVVAFILVWAFAFVAARSEAPQAEHPQVGDEGHARRKISPEEAEEIRRILPAMVLLEVR